MDFGNSFNPIKLTGICDICGGPKVYIPEKDTDKNNVIIFGSINKENIRSNWKYPGMISHSVWYLCPDCMNRVQNEMAKMRESNRVEKRLMASIDNLEGGSKYHFEDGV